MELPPTGHTPDDTSMQILKELYDEFAQNGFSMTCLSSLTGKMREHVFQLSWSLSPQVRLFLLKNSSLKMLEYFLEQMPQGYEPQRIMLLERIKTEHEKKRESLKTREETHRQSRNRPFFTSTEQFLTGRGRSNPESDSITITDKSGSIIGIVIHGHFRWLCSKADVGKILAYLQTNHLREHTMADIVARAVRLLPDIARSRNNAEAIKSAIKDAKKPERTATAIDIESASEAVARYL